MFSKDVRCVLCPDVDGATLFSNPLKTFKRVNIVAFDQSQLSPTIIEIMTEQPKQKYQSIKFTLLT